MDVCGSAYKRIYREEGQGMNESKVKCLKRLLLVFLAVILLGTNLVSAAEENYDYPSVKSKKGLYVSPGMEEDAIELGIRHATINLSVGDFMPTDAYRNSIYCEKFMYGGETYWFDKNALEKYDRELNRLARNNVLVTAILLLPNRTDALRNLIYPSALGRSAFYYQWNMTDASAVKTLKAIVTFFQRRYSKKNGPRIVGWIVGNEVNNSTYWNWAGNISVDTYMDLYAAQVAAVYSAARKVYANARIYICLDHHWSVGNGSGWYAGRTILTKFAAHAAAKGLKKGSWNIAYHPYNISQYVVDIMSSSDAVTNSVNTRIITMKNLNVLTDYVKSNYTSSCRIILSEQGYSSVTSGRDTSSEQAKNIALAYCIAQQNSMVDALILHRHVDNAGEAEKYGLYTGKDIETAARKKPSWTAYKYADTTKKNTYTTYAALQAGKLLGKEIKNVVSVRSGKLKKLKTLKWNKNFTNHFTPYGAYAGFLKDGSAYTVTRDITRNANLPLGFTRKGKINCNIRKKLGFGISANGIKSGKAYVTLRLWSGNRNYYEATGTIRTGKWYYFYVDLNKWTYRSNITKVDIVVSSEGSGWTSGGSVSVRGLGTKK